MGGHGRALCVSEAEAEGCGNGRGSEGRRPCRERGTRSARETWSTSHCGALAKTEVPIASSLSR
jgi:hypothetical protein